MEDSHDDSMGSADSAASDPVTRPASVTITEYSPVISGNIGESVGGVTVTLSLARSSTTVAGATATTDDNGAWHATLRPVSPATGPSHGFYVDDALAVSYAPPAGSPTQAVPSDSTYVEQTQFLGAVISPDGTTVVLNGFVDCRHVRYVVNGTAEVPNETSRCPFSPAAPFTDADHVLVQYVSGGALWRANVGLLGESNPPTCDADLVSHVVTCGSLNTGQFVVALDGGSPVSLTTSDENPTTGSATLPGLKPGDTITLDETSPTPTSRHLTSLHVQRLQVALDAGGFLSGRCQSGAPLSNGVCSLDGALPPIGTSPPDLRDDRSGGAISVTTPSLTDFIPARDASLFGGTFTAYVNLAGSGTPTQLLAETRSVRLKIRPDGSSTAVFNQMMTTHITSDDAFASADVSGLSVGRYYAEWVLTDTNGDTNTFETLFAVQPLQGSGLT